MSVAATLRMSLAIQEELNKSKDESIDVDE